MTKQNHQYLREIDGLRALAVLSVMFFHLDSNFLPGGFTGVDVFFVISGYVVSRAMVGRGIKPLGHFLADFFSRRFVRILPALILCLSLTVVLSILFIPQSWLSSTMNKAGIWAYFGASNIALVLFQDSYFSPRAEFNPFTHTWSLGVEEQFYLVLPFVLFAWLKWGASVSAKGYGSRALLPLLIFSSLVAAYVMGRSNPAAAYYLLPSRFWELGAGVMLFVAQYRGHLPPLNIKGSLTFLGSGLILVFAGFIYADGNQFPYPWALLPVSGTLLCLYAVSATQPDRSYLYLLLNNPVATYVGKTSYSLYLWHWPVYAIFRWTLGLEYQWMPLALVITFACASASYHLVEEPVRNSEFLKKRAPIVKVSVGVLLIAGLAWLAGQGFTNQKQLTLSVTGDVYNWYPYAHPERKLPKGEKPLAGRTLFVVGNSHTPAYSTMLRSAQDRLGIKVVKFPLGFCNLGNLIHSVRDRAGCEQPVEGFLSRIEKELKPGDMVFFASLRAKRLMDQWAAFDYEQGQQRAEIDDLPGRAESRSSPTAVIEFADLKAQGEHEGWAEHRMQGVEETAELIELLADKGVYALIDAPKPVFQIPPFRCSDWFNRDNPICALGPNIDRRELLELRQPTMASMAVLESRYDNVVLWDPFPVLCPDDPCSPYDSEGLPLFFDGDHLSAHGNRLLYPDFARVLLETLDSSN